MRDNTISKNSATGKNGRDTILKLGVTRHIILIGDKTGLHGLSWEKGYNTSRKRTPNKKRPTWNFSERAV